MMFVLTDQASSRRQGITNEDLLNTGILVNSIAKLYRIELKHWVEVFADIYAKPLIKQIMEAAESAEESDSTPYDID